MHAHWRVAPYTLPLPLPPTPPQELVSAIAEMNAAAPPEISAYAVKVDSLRKRLEDVEHTMSRVKIRIESLQAAVTRFETKM